MSKRKSRGCGFPFLPQVPLSRPPTEGKRGETPICVCVHEQARGRGGVGARVFVLCLDACLEACASAARKGVWVLRHRAE